MALPARKTEQTPWDRLKAEVERYGDLRAEYELRDGHYPSQSMEAIFELSEDIRDEQFWTDRSAVDALKFDTDSALSDAELYILFRPETTAAELLELLKSSLPSLTLE